MENEINFEGRNPVREFFEKLQYIERAKKTGCDKKCFEKLTNELHSFIEENHAELVLLAPLCFVRKERKSFKNTKEGIDTILKNDFTIKDINSIIYQIKGDITLSLQDRELMFRIDTINKIKRKLIRKFYASEIDNLKVILIAIKEITKVIESGDEDVKTIYQITKAIIGEIENNIDLKKKQLISI